ncbi:MAG: hypothetical protein WC565_08270 [Parcubacteria group bacterium]
MSASDQVYLRDMATRRGRDERPLLRWVGNDLHLTPRRVQIMGHFSGALSVVQNSYTEAKSIDESDVPEFVLVTD